MNQLLSLVRYDALCFGCYRVTTENAKKNNKSIIFDLVITAGPAGLITISIIQLG